MRPALRSALREALCCALIFGAVAVATVTCGCYAIVAPPEPPPVVTPPPGPVLPPPPVQPPPPAPASVDEILSRIAVGQTPAETAASVGSAPTTVPGSQGAAGQLRWLLVLPDGTFLVYAVLGADGRVASKGWARVGSNP